MKSSLAASAFSVAMLLSSHVEASQNVIGQLYSISEPDALEQIQERVANVDWQKELNKDREKWGAFKGVPLPTTQEDKTRKVIPFYSAPFEVKDKDGRLLFPKGYTFNPLVHVRLPQRLIIVEKGQEDWLKSVATESDMIIYASGDVIEVSQRIGRNAFILDKNLQQRLDIKVVPSIIQQEGEHLIIQEFSKQHVENAKDKAQLDFNGKKLAWSVVGSVMDFLVSPAHATCKSSFINPITDISWSCIFPMRIAGVQVVGGEENPSNSQSPVCVCKGAALPMIGLKTSFWEPKRIIDTVSDPYCMMPLGTQLSKPVPGTLAGGYIETNTSKRVFQQAHYFIFPAWKILNMFYDIPCLDDEGFDVAMMTEILPQWNNEALSLIINPEALLFANPVATIACSADAIAGTYGMPLNALFWCMGSWGNVYPLSGSITSTDFVEANAGIAARSIFTMGRLGLLWNTSDDGCYRELAPIWKKDRFKLQLMRPTRANACLPIGREGLLWTGGKHDPLKDNFMWMMFEKKDCCIRAY
ncbi:TraU family protein [Yersinia ruckeri]